MFFSVLIPVYNAEKYIDRCLKSIINQTEKDYEIILVDDGSTDASYSKCKEWEKKYPQKVKTAKKENSGSLETRRVCLENASGDYLYMIDADDYLLEDDALQSVRECIEKTNSDLVIFNATIDRTKRNQLYQYPFVDGQIFEAESLNNVYKVLLEGTELNTLWNKVFSRNLVDWQADYSNCQEIIKGTDFYQLLPILSNAKKIVYLDRVLYLYYVENSISISHKFKPLLFKTACIQHQRLVSFSEPWVIKNADKEQLLKRRFTSDVAQILLMINYESEMCINKKISFLKSVRNNDMYLNNHTVYGIRVVKRIAIRLLDMRFYYLLLLYVKLLGLYKWVHEKYLK